MDRTIPYAAPGTPERQRLTAEADERVRRGCVALMMSAPFFGTLVAYLDFKARWPEDWPSGAPCTASTNGKSLFYNPMFVLSLDHDQVCWVLCHEVMHPALSHIARLYERDPEVWNEAADFVVNGAIDDFTKTTKSQASRWRMYENGLLDHKHDGKTADAIYDELMKQQQKSSNQGQGQGQGQGSQKPSQNGNGSSNKQGISREQAEEDVRKGVTRMLPNPDAQADPAEREAQEREWADRLTSAVQVAKNMGTMPAGLERLIDEVLKPVVDWREVLQRFVKDTDRSDYRWNRPNRSYIAGGIYLPGMYSEKMGEIVCVVDDSGSCYAEVPQFISECIGIFNEMPGTLLHLISCDTEPTHVLDWEAGNDDPAFEPKVAVRGGGGTSFVKPFDMIQEKDWKPRCVIYLTDLDGAIPGDDRNPGCPVLWICNNERHSQDELPFGELCVFTGLAKS